MRLDFHLHSALKISFSIALALSASAQTPKIISNFAGTGVSGNTGDGGFATNATMNSPIGIAVDSAGNFYISDYNACVVRKVNTSGIISTVAGTGTCAVSTDGGQATTTALIQPSGLAIDSSNNLYIAEYSASRVRLVNSSGIISTFAGTGIFGATGDGGAATSARLSRPFGLAFDSAQNLYIADPGSQQIRKVSAGIITTVAGTGTAGSAGDGGQATAAQLNYVYEITLDTANNIYVAEAVGNRIRKINTSGVIATIAGTGTSGFSGDGGPATSAKLSGSNSVAVDAQGNVYIIDSGNYRIRQINTSGMISTIAGTGISGFSGNGGPATSARLGSSYGLYVSPGGRLYVGDGGNHVIRLISVSSISTLPSTAVNASSAAIPLDFGSVNGLGSTVSLQSGSDFSVNSAGCSYTSTPGFQATCPVTFTPLYPGLRWDALILKDSGGAVIGTQYVYGLGQASIPVITPGLINSLTTGSVGTVSSEGGVFDFTGNLYLSDGPNNRIVKKASGGGLFSVLTITGATLNNPKGLVLDGAGNLYVSNSGTNQVLKIAPDGTATAVPIAVSLSAPSGLAMDTSRTLYVADTGNARIVEYSLDAATSTLSVTPSLTSPSGLAFADDGTLYISDPGTASIVKVTSAGVSSTLTITGATLSSPSGIATDRAGNLYAADSNGNVVYLIKADGSASVVAGNGTAGSSGDSGLATSAAISAPKGLLIGPGGSLYFSDSANGRIRQVAATPTVAFPNTAINGTSNLTSLFSNIGNSAITFPGSFALTLNPSRFSLFNSGSSDCSTFLNSQIAPAATCTLQSQFAPTATGLFTNNISLNNGLQIFFRGSGQALAISGLNTNVLNLGSEPVSTTSAVQTVTLLNTGTGPLNIASFTLSGSNAAEFAATNNCGATLAANANCTISVTFTPTSIGSSKSATLIITASDAGSGVSLNQTIFLSGIGVGTAVAGSATVDTVSLSFGNLTYNSTSAAQTVTLSNSGTGTLNIASAVISGINAADFALVNGCSSTLAASASCALSITFHPSTIGQEQALLTITDSDATALVPATQTVTLIGTGIAPAVGAVPAGIMSIISLNSGRALDILNASTLNGAPLQQYDYVNGVNQMWRAIPVESPYYKIVNVGSGKVLDAVGQGITDGTRVQQWNYLGGDNQKWQFVPQEDGTFEIVNKASGKALDVLNVSMANQARIQIWTYNATNNQKWQLTAITLPPPAVQYYAISSLATGKVLDATGASSNDAVRIQQYDYLHGANQEWELVPAAGGYYQIVNRLSGKVLDAERDAPGDGAPVQQYTYFGLDNQQWQLIATANGYYQIVNKASGKSLDITGMSSANGALLQTYTYWGGRNQQFELDPVVTP